MAAQVMYKSILTYFVFGALFAIGFNTVSAQEIGFNGCRPFKDSVFNEKGAVLIGTGPIRFECFVSNDSDTKKDLFVMYTVQMSNDKMPATANIRAYEKEITNIIRTSVPAGATSSSVMVSIPPQIIPADYLFTIAIHESRNGIPGDRIGDPFAFNGVLTSEASIIADPAPLAKPPTDPRMMMYVALAALLLMGLVFWLLRRSHRKQEYMAATMAHTHHDHSGHAAHAHSKKSARKSA